MLFPIEDIDGVWCSWCPEFDIVSQGDGPDHAIGMLSDAIRLVAEDDLDLLSFSWEVLFPSDHPMRKELTRKRVRHPLRRGDSARDDEDWIHFEAYRSLVGEWRRTTDIETCRLDRAIDRSVVRGDLDIRSRGGIVHCDVHFSDYAVVPSRSFDVKVRIAREIDLIVSVPTAVLAEDSVLRRAGMSVESIALIEARHHMDSMSAAWPGAVVSIGERPHGR